MVLLPHRTEGKKRRGVGLGVKRATGTPIPELLTGLDFGEATGEGPRTRGLAASEESPA